jgi:gem associated protein 5
VNDESFARLVVASHGGELLWCDVRVDDGRETTSGRQETLPNVHFSKFAGDGHSKTVFCISVRGNLAVTTSLDRSLVLWDVGKLTRRWSVAGLGGFAYHAAVDPEDPRRVAVACGDGSVRAHVLADTPNDDDPTHEVLTHDAANAGASTILWRGLPQTKATRLAWRPADGPAAVALSDEAGAEPASACLAVGLEDGRVVALDPAGAGRHATQRDCHAGAVTGAQWVRLPGGTRELVTLGGGRLWRWVSLAAPAGRRRGGGGDGGAFVDVTLRFHDAATAEGATITSFEFAEHEAAEHEASRSVGLPAAAVGWSDGTVTAHARDDAEPGDPFAFRVAWRAAEHSKAVSAVRWHPSAGDPASPRHAWLGSVSEDGGFLVYDGRDGEAVRSAPPSRRSLTDLAWRPAGAAAAAAAARSDAGDRLSAREAPLDASDAIAVTTGADGVVRGWDLSSSPAPAATMRGHEGRALFAAWAGARAARRARGAPTATLVTGSDDQTVRAWEVDDLCHSPAAEAEASARAKEAKQAKKLARDAEAKRGGEPTARSEGDGSADAEAASATSSTEPTEITKDSGTDKLQSAGGASGKKKRKGTGGRGIVKPPPWETTPEGIAAGRASAVRLARLLARRNTVGSPGVAADGSDESLDDASAGYGPRGLGLYLGQEEAMRLLRLEESVCGGDGAGGAGFRTRRGGRRPTPTRFRHRGFELFRRGKRCAPPPRTRRRRGFVPRGLRDRLRVPVRGVRRTHPARFPRRARRGRARALRLRRRDARRTDWKPAANTSARLCSVCPCTTSAGPSARYAEGDSNATPPHSRPRVSCRSTRSWWKRAWRSPPPRKRAAAPKPPPRRTSPPGGSGRPCARWLGRAWAARARPPRSPS